VFIMGQRSDAQWLICLSAEDGKELWATRLGAIYTNDFGNGPQGTPTVADGSVFALSASGDLLCASAADGKEQWRVNMSNFGGKFPGWGYSESPLVDGDRVAVTPGGEKGGVVALEAKTGKLIWQKLICVDEVSGTVVLAEASTKAWTELSRFTPAPQSTRRATSGRVWSIPVVSGGRLYLLRDQEQMWCFNIAGR
jgi:outer membrane protein assembly factor BamB